METIPLYRSVSLLADLDRCTEKQTFENLFARCKAHSEK